ncbi:MAG: D-2-hydroxyacid dehydrogenase, partial [Tenericutes bacterium HGW-Tenericutes-3]
SIQIAEDVFSKILYFNRNIQKHIKHMENKLWKFEPVRYEIAHATIGILGTGSIGLEVAKRMKAFDTKVLGYKKTRQNVPYFDEIYTDKKGLEKIYKESDYIIIALPLTTETYHLIDENAISLMKDSSVIINVARGDIIDQKALINALKSKKIRAAGLDVMSPEPLPIDDGLWHLENVLLTPHNASSSPYVNQRLINNTIETIQHYLSHQNFNNRVV